MTNPKTQGILKLLDSHEKVIAMIHAKWCSHCTDLLPKWHEIVKTHPNFNRNVYDIEQNEYKGEVVTKIGNVGAYPTILSIDEEGQRNEYTGARDEESIVEWINAELKNPNNKPVNQLPARKIAKVPSATKPKKMHMRNKNSKSRKNTGKKKVASQKGGYTYGSKTKTKAKTKTKTKTTTTTKSKKKRTTKPKTTS
jgi:thiol-disulfide isomerase/thioredoxin